MTEIDKRVAKLPPEYLQCRRYRHFFNETGIYRYTEGGVNYIIITSECATCSQQRDDYYNRQGEFQFSRRRYPDGYLLELTEKEREEGVRLGPRVVNRVIIRGLKIRNVEERPGRD